MFFALSLIVKRELLILFLLVFSLSAWGKESPSITLVQQKAIEYADLKPQQVTRWRKKLRQSAWLPRLQVGVDRQLRNDVDVRIEDSISVTSSGVVVGPEDTQQVLGQNRNFNFGVKAVWYLGETLFSPHDLNISREARAIAEDRERLLLRVNHLYFSWLAAKDTQKKELEAGLDVYTGGWFTLQLENKKENIKNGSSPK